jgi:hypothetical protein
VYFQTSHKTVDLVNKQEHICHFSPDYILLFVYIVSEMLTESRAEPNESYGYNIYPEIVKGSLVSQDASIFLFWRPEHMINYGKSLYSN